METGNGRSGAEESTKEAVAEFITAAQEQQRVADLEARKQWGARWGVDPGSRPHRLSHWALSNLDQCDYRYYLVNVLGVQLLAKPLPLALGDAFDQGFNTWMRSGSLDDGLRTFREAWATLQAQVDWSEAQWDAPTWETIGTNMYNRLQPLLRDSEPYAVQHRFDHAPITNPDTGETLQGFVMTGKLDFCDKVAPPETAERFHVLTDLKTCKALTPEAMEYIHTRMSLQLAMYAYMAQYDELLRDLPGIGQIVSFLEAQKLKGKPTSSPGVKRTWADTGPDTFRELFHLCRGYASRILSNQAQEDAGAPAHQAWPRNLGGCIGKYGPCEMLRLCRPELFEGDPVANYTLRGAT